MLQAQLYGRSLVPEGSPPAARSNPWEDTARLRERAMISIITILTSITMHAIYCYSISSMSNLRSSKKLGLRA